VCRAGLTRHQHRGALTSAATITPTASHSTTARTPRDWNRRSKADRTHRCTRARQPNRELTVPAQSPARPRTITTTATVDATAQFDCSHLNTRLVSSPTCAFLGVGGREISLPPEERLRALPPNKRRRDDACPITDTTPRPAEIYSPTKLSRPQRTMMSCERRRRDWGGFEVWDQGRFIYRRDEVL
jgi:hypothetical protein